jgi:hypothetical protein
MSEQDETAAILADPETMAAIVEAEAERGPVSPELRKAADDAWDAKPPPRAEHPRCATCGRAAHWPGSPGPHGHPYLAPDA